ncbi:MAG: M20/M25/M40 family metallo-hydrolase [Pseudomonadota bacterium]
MINTDRMRQRFTLLAETDSISREEGKIASMLAEILDSMGAEVVFDNAGEKVGGQCGNLIARFKGTVDAAPIFLSGHMDTVEPGRGVKVIFEDGIFKSDGTTILGGDDKSALAIILEVMETLIENDIPRGPVEIVFTICEEIGLMGAKHIDLSLIRSKIGYILDSTDLDGIVTRAPAANKISIRVHGKDAHAGASPENGINAIAVASKAIAGIRLGRIDFETTCNLGMIKGGKATNIVPDLVMIEGEARSHDDTKLETITNTIVNAFYGAADSFRIGDDPLPRVDIDVEDDFPSTHIPDDHPVVRLAQKAASSLGRSMGVKTIGGGADANIFFGKGIVAGVLGTGMTDVHTVRESISLKDMEDIARLVLEIVRIHAQGATFRP